MADSKVSHNNSSIGRDVLYIYIFLPTQASKERNDSQPFWEEHQIQMLNLHKSL